MKARAVLYFANPTGEAVRDAMAAGALGFIKTPAQGNKLPDGVTWCADNGCFSDRWDEAKWWKSLVDNAHRASSCLFAVAPDVVGDALATQERSEPWLQRIRDLGYPVAYVAQDGLEDLELPHDGTDWWDSFDVLFIGGTTEWKLGRHARRLVAEAKRRGKWVHMGRVNSEKRYRYADAIGCDSVDGTFLTFGPDTNLPRLLRWLRIDDQHALFTFATHPETGGGVGTGASGGDDPAQAEATSRVNRSVDTPEAPAQAHASPSHHEPQRYGGDSKAPATYHPED